MTVALSPEIQVMLSPAAAYRRCATRAGGGGLWVAARRPLFVALLQGVAIAMMATNTVAAPTVASVTLCWSAAVLVQLLAGTALILSAPRRAVSFTRAVDLFYLGHAPWSLWLLACAAGARAPITWLLPYFSWIVLLAMAVAAALTARILVAFAQTVLGLDRRAAVRRTALHQTVIWLVLLGYFAAAVALWPRIVGVIR